MTNFISVANEAEPKKTRQIASSNSSVDSTCLADTLVNQLRVVQARARAVVSDSTNPRRLGGLADVFAQAIRLGVLGFCVQSSEGWSITQSEIRSGNAAMLGKLAEFVKRLKEQIVVSARLAEEDCVWRVIALRIRPSAGLQTGLLVTYRESSVPDEWVIALFEAVASEFAIAQTEEAHRGLALDLECSAAVLELAALIESSDSLAEACQRFVERVSSHLNATVAIGLAKASHANGQLKAISGVAGVDLAAPRSQSVAAALDEVLIHAEPTAWPPANPIARHSLLTHRRLVEDGFCESVLGMPIKTADGQLLGSWICLGDRALPDNVSARRFVQACGYRLGTTIRLLQRADRSRWHRAINRLRLQVGGSIKRSAMITALVIAGILAVPWPHRLKCKCELQPVTRRFIAAPFDGTLEKAFVEPGDVVNEGDLLARIDGREIDWELAGVDAEQQKAFKDQDSRLAKREIAASQLARYEVERLELRRRLLNHRGDHLEIRSPIAGLVLIGDLKRSEGVPLTVGKNLFEIAPIDRMIVEVAIPERDIKFASTEQKVDLTLEGFPNTHWEGTLLRIHPRSEMRDRESVFIGEFELDNSDRRLLPGMHGQAKLQGSLQPIGWLIGHRAWESFIFWIGW